MRSGIAAETAGVACEIIGVTGERTLTLGFGTAILLDDLVRVHEGWLPGYMAGRESMTRKDAKDKDYEEVTRCPCHHVKSSD